MVVLAVSARAARPVPVPVLRQPSRASLPVRPPVGGRVATRGAAPPVPSPSFSPFLLASNPRRGRRAAAAAPPLRARSGSEENLSESIDPALRRAVEDAIDRLGSRVTVGDVAASAGLPVDSAAAALNAVAADCSATLEVASSGDLVYTMPGNFREELRRKSLKVRLEPVAAKTKAALGYLIRVSFGTALVVSAITVWVAIAAILSSGRSRDNDRGGGNSYLMTRSFINLSDLFWYWDPYYSRRMQYREEGMSFVESIFSFVFGDGDPNADFDDLRWKQLGRVITAKGGVVTAEEMSPYLVAADAKPPPADKGSGDSPHVDESFVLPALVRFGGEAEVDSKGNILYRFPSLQTTAGSAGPSGRDLGGWWGDAAKVSQSTPMEQPLKFSAASVGQKVGTVALGIFNGIGVVWLSALMASPQSLSLGVSSGTLALISGLLPLLQAYALCFFVIPFVRAVMVTKRNADIEARNRRRREQTYLLENPAPAVRQKIAEARKQSQRKVLKRQDSIFTSDKDTSDQSYDPVAEDFDRRLRGL